MISVLFALYCEIVKCMLKGSGLLAMLDYSNDIHGKKNSRLCISSFGEKKQQIFFVFLFL